MFYFSSCERLLDRAVERTLRKLNKEQQMKIFAKYEEEQKIKKIDEKLKKREKYNKKISTRGKSK